jgi:tripartite-type tricarboxylate transporter receptor subunit TctC
MMNLIGTLKRCVEIGRDGAGSKGRTSMDVARLWRALLGAALLLIPAASGLALAQGDAAGYPNKNIRILVGFAAGGGNDIFARVVGQKLQELLGQSVVVENKPGAGGRLAVEYVAGQAPDGYTLLVAPSGSMSVAAGVFDKLPYHPTRSFVPLTMIADFPLILVVAADHPAKTVQELVAWAKAHPDKANYATTSPAFIVTTELLKLKTGMPGVGIPYKSSNEMLMSVIGGNSLLAIADGPPTIPQVKGGKVRALAVTGSRRSPELPDVPSMAEAGYPEVNIRLWSGFFAPASTPPAITKKLEATLREAIKDPSVQEKLKTMAVEPGGGPGEEFARMIDKDIKNYREIAKAANLTFKQ